MRNLFNYFFYYRPSAKESFGGVKMRPVSYRKWRKFNKEMYRVRDSGIIAWVEGHPDWEKFYD